MTLIWLLIVIVLGLIELFTVNLVTIWFVASGIVALVLSYFDVPVPIQVTVFVILGIILLFTTKKPLEKMLNKTKQKTNVDRVLDMEGIVTEEIDKNSPGEVKVDGKRWTAIADTKIPKDATVKILKIEGVKLIVEEVK
jgi:membrane protein implicated in regulation of membrane protease activity